MPTITTNPSDPIYARMLENKRTITASKRRRFFSKKSNSIYPLSAAQNNLINTRDASTTRTMQSKH